MAQCQLKGLKPFQVNALRPRQHGVQHPAAESHSNAIPNSPTALNRDCTCCDRAGSRATGWACRWYRPAGPSAAEDSVPHAAALGAVVHFELELVDCPLFLTAQPLPPRREGIDNEVTGFGGTPEGHLESGRCLPREFHTGYSGPCCQSHGRSLCMSPRVCPPRANAPSLTVALPSMLNRLTPGVASRLAWSFFEIRKTRISFRDLFLRFGFEPFA